MSNQPLDEEIHDLRITLNVLQSRLGFAVQRLAGIERRLQQPVPADSIYSRARPTLFPDRDPAWRSQR